MQIPMMKHQQVQHSLTLGSLFTLGLVVLTSGNRDALLGVMAVLETLAALIMIVMMFHIGWKTQNTLHPRDIPLGLYLLLISTALTLTAGIPETALSLIVHSLGVVLVVAGIFQYLKYDSHTLPKRF